MFWLPFFVGFGMASPLFFSFYFVLPYFLVVALFSWLLIQKSQWIYRYKEGFLSFLGIYGVYLIAVVVMRVWIWNYEITASFWSRFAITFGMEMMVWLYLMNRRVRGKIR